MSIIEAVGSVAIDNGAFPNALIAEKDYSQFCAIAITI